MTNTDSCHPHEPITGLHPLAHRLQQRARMETLYHHVAVAAPGTLLFRDPVEADALVRIFVCAFPELDAFTAMPDHAHLGLPHADEGGKLERAEGAYARWRNAYRGQSGPAWARHLPVEEVPWKRRRRVLRYIYLNPTRAGLVEDPLAWPWGTYRDRLGLVFPRAGPLERDAARFHRYVSSDETVRIGGTELPSVRQPVGWPEVVDAVLAVCRASPAALEKRGPVRRLAVQAGWVLGIRDLAVLLPATGLSRSRLYALVAEVPPIHAVPERSPLGAVIRLAGDPRFQRWTSLPSRGGWSRYGALR